MWSWTVWIVAGLTLWVVVALLVGTVIGRAIRRRDLQVPRTPAPRTPAPRAPRPDADPDAAAALLRQPPERTS